MGARNQKAGSSWAPSDFSTSTTSLNHLLISAHLTHPPSRLLSTLTPLLSRLDDHEPMKKKSLLLLLSWEIRCGFACICGLSTHITSATANEEGGITKRGRRSCLVSSKAIDLFCFCDAFDCERVRGNVARVHHDSITSHAITMTNTNYFLSDQL